MGFTYYKFVTKYDSSLGMYKTTFEGYIKKETLVKFAGYDGETLRLGYAFKSSNDTTADTISVGGNTLSYWCGNHQNPRLLGTLLKKQSV